MNEEQITLKMLLKFRLKATACEKRKKNILRNSKSARADEGEVYVPG